MMAHTMCAKFLLSWLITVACETDGEMVSFFTRNVRLDNKEVCDSPVDILTSIRLDQCARKCYHIQSCASFFYNLNDRKCQLYSQIHVDPEDTATEKGNVNFWKQRGICNVPPAIAKGRVLYVDGQVEGSKAEFACDDYHIPTSEAGICTTPGTWVGLDYPCQHKVLSPYVVPAVGKVKPGSCVVVMATPTVENEFRFRLKKDQDNYSLNIRVNFTRKEISRSSKVHDAWVKPAEKEYSSWPFAVNQEFILTVCAEENMYKGYIDNAEIFTYNNRSPMSEIATVYMDTDVALRKIRFVYSEWNQCKGSA